MMTAKSENELDVVFLLELVGDPANVIFEGEFGKAIIQKPALAMLFLHGSPATMMPKI
jgi:hypothetical protein